MFKQDQRDHYFSAYASLALTLFLVSFLVTGGQATALPTELEVSENTRVVPDLTRSTYKQLDRVQRDIDRRRFEKAEAKLRKILESTALNNNEIAVSTNMLAFVCFQTNRRSESAAHYRQVLAYRNSISKNLELGVLKTLAEFAFTSQDYNGALDYADQWQSLSNEPSAEISALTGMARYKLKQNAAAAISIMKAIEIEVAAEREPKKNWLELIAYLHNEQRDWANYVHYQEMYLKRFPTQKGWANLANAYTNLGQLDAAKKAQEKAEQLEAESP